MKHTITYLGRNIEVPEDKLEQLNALLGIESIELSQLPEGGTFIVGDYEFIVLEQLGELTAVILKGLYGDDEVAFGSNNNYNGSAVDELCNEFAQKVAAIIGEGNIAEHTVDLTSDDGLKDYGSIFRNASLITAEDYRKWVYILDKHNPGAWWWLATPYSTKTHGNDSWVKCVSPSGGVDDDGCGYGGCGVRPFCIFESSISVSL